VENIIFKLAINSRLLLRVRPQRIPLKDAAAESEQKAEFPKIVGECLFNK